MHCPNACNASTPVPRSARSRGFAVCGRSPEYRYRAGQARYGSSRSVGSSCAFSACDVRADRRRHRRRLDIRVDLRSFYDGFKQTELEPESILAGPGNGRGPLVKVGLRNRFEQRQIMSSGSSASALAEPGSATPCPNFPRPARRTGIRTPYSWSDKVLSFQDAEQARSLCAKAVG